MAIKISVIVITFNQEDKILRCLNSILLSETGHLELIVADDCSSDNTPNLVDRWLSEKGSEFLTTSFIKRKINLGTVANICDAIAASHGQFIKLIAGDDWFCEGALDYFFHLVSSSSFDAAFSPVLIALEDDSKNVELTGARLEASKKENFFSLSSQEQFNILSVIDVLPAPGAFFSRRYWDRINLERYGFKISEDWPMWILGSLYEMKFIKISHPLVVYLQHKKSVTQDITKPAYKTGIQDTLKMYRDIVFRNKSKLTTATLLKVYANYFALYLFNIMPSHLVFRITEMRRKLISKFL